MKKRKNYTQLPSIKELESILKKEAKRPLAKGKQNLHYVEFGTVIDWLEYIGIPSDAFNEDSDWKRVVSIGSEIESEVVRKTLLKVEQSDEEFLKLLKNITEYLGEEDQPKKSDLIFVFGSQKIDRIAMAVDLWKEGLAPQIFISGARPHYSDPSIKAEAIVFQEYALENGVPREKLIVESNSITFADNVRRSLNLMDEKGLNYSKMILITAWFAMRRAYSQMMKYVPKRTKLFRVAYPLTSGDFTKTEWYRNEKGIKVVFNEFVKMKTGIILNSN